MMKREWSRLLQSVCTTLTLMIVVFDLPRWALAAALVLAAVTLADAVLALIQGGRRA